MRAGDGWPGFLLQRVRDAIVHPHWLTALCKVDYKGASGTACWTDSTLNKSIYHTLVPNI
jgi:hypothetical protein